MVFDAHVLKVFISTPGDTAEEVNAVRDGLHDWNADRAETSQTILLPKFWKTDAVPQMSPSGGQSVVNSQLLDDADIVVALFDSRLGQATASAVSGTAEEIERAADAGKPVHVWFSNEPLDHNVDLDELARLRAFKKELEQKGLLGVYQSPSDLAYKVRSAIERDVAQMGLGAPSVVRKGEHALPRVYVEREVDHRGKPRTYVVIENKSTTTTSKELQVDLGPWERAVYRENNDPFDLPPLQRIRWSVGFDMGMPLQITANLIWQEDSGTQSEAVPVTSN
ncbi:hypothetical protein U3653_25245 [Nocardia sp. CDC186]|uniref:DUF4062 domain-containing protein n=1 Tax=Nocardia implantans TaxID=3108168 RepID=A0ABU6B0T5_9NOCA|nr:MULTISPECIES: DUF4062 domain-containing protein [unclassified Nocardia]MBF6195425.1 DUF4062 domain-containing protein [Nocardia beijingensis]MEA3532066.1 hypothetical protein [Nocardia sp. CDC192]MEB3513344.1 hypothetical protein [Nocardia sp. CDC186]